MAARPPLKVSVPEPERERPRFAKLGLIALVCFAIGLIWPELVGMGFVQRPPGTAPKTEPETPSPGPQPDPGAPPRDPSPGTPERAVARVEPSVLAAESTRLEDVVVVSCRDAGGQALSDCDVPDVTAALAAPIAKLASCDGAAGATGVLSLGLELDFARGRVAKVKAGRSTTLSRDMTAALLACAEDVMVGTRLGDAKHAHPTYWAYYMVRFVPPGSADDAEPEVVQASGRGTIGWQTAVVREDPTRQGKIVARLLYGTRVEVSGRAGDWYRVIFDSKGNTGWVHRKALGL
jgi:hypothetical protein